MGKSERLSASEIAPQEQSLRAALYLRVSTGRQADGDVSIPSQGDLTTRYCANNGWTVVDEFIEPGAGATDDRRPVFQAMLERLRWHWTGQKRKAPPPLTSASKRSSPLRN
jgi:hypothetical protein